MLSNNAENNNYLVDLSGQIQAAFAAASSGLTRIEEKTKASLGSDAKLISEISHYLLSLGGKRMRPLLAILSEKLFKVESSSEDLITAASGIELIHMATLLHDDIIDQSPTRRRQESAYKKYGVTPTLLTGDFLLVKAFGLCATLDEFIITETEKACVALTEGELLEGHIDPETGYELDDYIDVIDKKTASLFALSGIVGAHLSGTSKDNVELLRSFGKNAGIAFQVIDDILDVTADEDLLGKPAGTDLKQKTPSIINILWLYSGDIAAKEYFKTKSPTIEHAKAAIEKLPASVIEDARKLAVSYAEKAKDSLLSLNTDQIEISTQGQLLALVDYMLKRCL